MFRHKGKSRTLKHNLRIASLLSFVAGIVNVAGFLAIQRLTTNVTGHFAYLIDEVFRLELLNGLIYFLYIFFFFLGSFTSNFIIEWISRNKKTSNFAIPIFIESAILLSIALSGEPIVHTYPNLLAFSLLFAMGLQNSLVTTISNATVRTTHLTGLFTDLGIDLSQLFFYVETAQRQKLFASIKLRLTIISFFFIGGIIGGIFYSHMRLYTLLIAGLALLLAIVYDTVRFKLIGFKRKWRKSNANYTE
jgi:uncharacterized membrane protein YoaK (UPF0700 family)